MRRKDPPRAALAIGLLALAMMFPPAQASHELLGADHPVAAPDASTAGPIPGGPNPDTCILDEGPQCCWTMSATTEGGTSVPQPSHILAWEWLLFVGTDIVFADILALASDGANASPESVLRSIDKGLDIATGAASATFAGLTSGAGVDGAGIHGYKEECGLL